MKKSFLAGAAAALVVALSLAPLAYGETTDAASGGPWARERTAVFDARLAGLHAGLKLTADQEKNWPTFENALRGVAKERSDRRAKMRAERDDDAPHTPMDRMRRVSEHMAQRSQDLKQVADAAAPLYASLDDGQKQIFGALFKDFAREGGHGRGHKRD